MNAIFMVQPQQGFILVTTLLYFLVISILTMAGFNNAILQTKITAHFYEKDIAFENAESALVIGEFRVRAGDESGAGSMSGANYNYHKHAENICGVYYQVDATGQYNAARSFLESIIQIPNMPSAECPVPAKRERVSWQELI